MAKKAAKQAPHLRVRIDPKLIARLERATEANGSTLTGEIVARLAESFDAADKIALIREQLDELRLRNDESQKELEADKQRFDEESRQHRRLIEEYRDKYRVEIKELQSQLTHMETAVDMVDMLLSNEASSALVRRIVGVLAASPDWTANAKSTKEMALKIDRLVQATPHVAAWEGRPLTGRVSATLGGNVSAPQTLTVSATLPAAHSARATSFSAGDGTVDSNEGEKNEGSHTRTSSWTLGHHSGPAGSRDWRAQTQMA